MVMCTYLDPFLSTLWRTLEGKENIGCHVRGDGKVVVGRGQWVTENTVGKEEGAQREGRGKQEDVQRLKVTIRLKTRFNKRDENVNTEVVSKHEMLTKMGNEFQNIQRITEVKIKVNTGENVNAQQTPKSHQEGGQH